MKNIRRQADYSHPLRTERRLSSCGESMEPPDFTGCAAPGFISAKTLWSGTVGEKELFVSNNIQPMSTKRSGDKPLLILDLDETLIYATRQPLRRQADFRLAAYHVYRRPHLSAFLEAVHEVYLLAVWSSASDSYVAEMVQRIVPSEIPLEFAWGRSRCVQKTNYDLEEQGQDGRYLDAGHYHFVKPLKKVKRLGYSLERTLIVDDTPHKSRLNYGNAIYPEPYYGDVQDEELPLLATYLMKLANCRNVRRIEKRGWRRQVL